MKKTFTYVRVQGGWWGRTELDKTLKVQAESAHEANMIVGRRKDVHKRLANGDYLSWRLATVQS